MGDNDDAGSDTSMSDFEDIDMTEEEMKALTEIEAALAANPNLYEKHLELIDVLRKAKMTTKLRAARQGMHARFPLSPELWLQWLEDEENAKADFTYLGSLYKLATEDYLSVQIWEKYLRFLIASIPQISEPSSVLREACEAAVRLAGLHLSEGHKLWELYRQIDAELTGSNAGNEILLRQLQVPLLENSEALRQWAESSNSTLQQLPDAVQKGYAKAQSMLDARREAETSVDASRPADTDLLAAYIAYIKLEEATKEVPRVQVLYERALARFPLTHILWQQYAQYLEHHQRDHSVIQRVYARAVRNCPWVAALWSRSLRALERGGASNAEHEELYNAARTAGLENPEDYMEIFLARLDYLRRSVSSTKDELWEKFESASEDIQTYFPDYVDRAFRIPAYWATCLWEIAKDHNKAKQVWEAALDSKLGMVAEAVLAYVAFEVSAKRLKEARSIFRKYHRKQMYGRGSLMIAHAWLRFEREHGSADDLLQAFIKTEPVFSEAASYETARADPQLAAQVDEAAAKVQKPKLSKEEQKALRQQRDPNFKADGRKQQKGKKRKQDTGPHRDNTANGPSASSEPVQPGAIITQSETPAASSKPDQARERAPKRKKGLGFEDEQKKRPKQEQASGCNPSEFTSTGDHEMTAPEMPGSAAVIVPSKAEQAGQSQDGAAADRSQGPSKSSQEILQAAEQTQESKEADAIHNSTDAEGSLVTNSQTSQAAGKEEPVPAQAAAEQPIGSSTLQAVPNRFRRKAFVKSIAEKSSDMDIRNLLETCGRILSVAMPLNPKTKKHKGFAYVTFASPEALQKALALHGTELHGHELKIAPASQEGFAYVEFETHQGLQNAVDMTGVEFMDKSLQIKVADLRSGPPGAGAPPQGVQGGRGMFPPRGGGGAFRGGRGGRGRGEQGRGRPGPHEPAGGAGRGARPNLDLDGGSNPDGRNARTNQRQAPKSNADFRAMLDKR